MAEILKNGLKTSEKKKETFGNIDVFSFDRITDGKKNGTREVYQVSDKRNIPTKGIVTDLVVGVLPTERFYFLFPWKECNDNGVLNFGKLQGVMEIAHGQRKDKVLNYDPFVPPKGLWNIHWVCPHGSIAYGSVNAMTLTSRIFGTSKIDPTNDANIEHCYYGNDLLTNNKAECQPQKDKYINAQKYVSGTISKRNKIMNYRLDKFNTGNQFEEHFNNGVGLVQCSTKIGMVITRNRDLKTTNLEEMLKSIKKWGFPTNLVFSSCRYIEPEKTWNESNNKGPMAFEALGGSVTLPNNKSTKGDKVIV